MTDLYPLLTKIKCFLIGHNPNHMFETGIRKGLYYEVICNDCKSVYWIHLVHDAPILCKIRQQEREQR